MDQDDQQVGIIVSRREALFALGAAGAALLVGCVPGLPRQATSPAGQATAGGSTQALSSATQVAIATTGSTFPNCVVRPALTEGPYFVDEKLNRSDIRSDPSDGSVKDGTPLSLVFHVSRIDGSACAPLAGATVDVWHCDAQGVYSDASDPSFNTKGKKFLRGYQVTDASGTAQFLTIYPGWYRGRAVHIHFKIRTAEGYDFTSQLFFDDAFSAQVYTKPPYASKGQPNMKNSDDGIFQGSGGQLTLQPVAQGDGYSAPFDIGLQMS
jgi:protocatechuate 3,4-dioxygenase beta subunit